MTEQPVALLLAEKLEQQFPVGTAQHYLDGEAAAELRRLHEVEKTAAAIRNTNRACNDEIDRLTLINAQLLEALEQIIDLPEDSRIHYKVARRAIAAAKEKS